MCETSDMAKLIALRASNPDRYFWRHTSDGIAVLCDRRLSTEQVDRIVEGNALLERAQRRGEPR